MKLTTNLLLAAALLLPAMGQEKRPNISLREEVRHAIDKGLKYLQEQRKPEGFWSEKDQPAVTALAVAAFLGDPSRDASDPLPEFIQQSLDFVASNAKRDGGIYGKAMANYNTSLCLTTLAHAKRPKDQEIMRKARLFLVGLQSDFGARGQTDNELDGGIGYGSSVAYSDLSNTHLALEALYYSRSLIADQPKDKSQDLNWDAAIKFVSRCQNLRATNDQAWASDDPVNKGGFIYTVGESKPAEMKLADGKVALRSYGSMSYAGLLSFIYADMDRADPRIKAVRAWLEKNYTVEENPGLGPEGQFYYYHTMAKTLALAGIDTFPKADGSKAKWREDLSKKLFNLQANDGSWVNANKRWWEGDPILVTSYALLTLERLFGGL